MMNTPTHTVGTAGRLAILAGEELEQLDAAALEVLADVGVSIPCERARAVDIRPLGGAWSTWRRRG